MAEGAGFEPAIRFPAYTLSRRAPSAARPPLRAALCGASAAHITSRARGASRLAQSSVDRALGFALDGPLRGLAWDRGVIRFLLRFVGLMLLAGAFAAAVIDGARSLAAQQLTLTSTGLALDLAFPNKFPLLQPFVEKRLHPLLWDPVLVAILSAPAFVDMAALGAVIFYLVRARAPAVGVSTRAR